MARANTRIKTKNQRDENERLRGWSQADAAGACHLVPSLKFQISDYTLATGLMCSVAHFAPAGPWTALALIFIKPVKLTNHLGHTCSMSERKRDGLWVDPTSLKDWNKSHKYNKTLY